MKDCCVQEIQNANVTEHHRAEVPELEPLALSLSGRSKAFAMFHNDSCGLRHSVPDSILLESVLPTALGRWHEGTGWWSSGLFIFSADPSILDFCSGSIPMPLDIVRYPGAYSGGFSRARWLPL